MFGALHLGHPRSLFLSPQPRLLGPWVREYREARGIWRDQAPRPRCELSGGTPESVRIGEGQGRLGKAWGRPGRGWGGVACSRAGNSSSVWDRPGALVSHTEAWIPPSPGAAEGPLGQWRPPSPRRAGLQLRAPARPPCQCRSLGWEPLTGGCTEVPVGCYRVGTAVGSSDKEAAGPKCMTQLEGSYRTCRGEAG